MTALEQCFLDPNTDALVFPPGIPAAVVILPNTCNDYRTIFGTTQPCPWGVEGDATPQPPGCCAFAEDVDSCCPEVDFANSSVASDVDAFEQYIFTYCQAAWMQPDPGECTRTAPVFVDDECVSGFSHPGDIHLDLDPSESYVSVTGPEFGSISSYLTGFGGAQSAPTSFLRAYAVGDSQIQTRSGKFTDLEIVMNETALVWGSNGNFILPSGQIGGITVQGYLDGQPVAWEVNGAGTAATGVMRPNQGFWNLNYSSTAGGYGVTVHLEGDASY